MTVKIRLTFFLLLFALLSPAFLHAEETIHEWLVPLMDAVFESILSADEIEPLYHSAKASSVEHLSGAALDLALSRCEYYMGMILQLDNRNREAAPHFTEGLKLAEKALAASPGADAWVMMGAHLAELCAVNSFSFTIANGLNVERYAKRALEYDSLNGAAHYLIASRWAYAPAPLHNYNRGIQMMKAIAMEYNADKDYLFKALFAVGYTYLRQRKHADARLWLEKALEIYPTNKYALKHLANANSR